MDGDVDINDRTYHFMYDERWRMVATFRGSDTSPKEEFIHHNAGDGGFGGSSYIDAVLLRDKDANTAWTSAADGTLEQRRYYCQNWRADVITLMSDTASLSENQRYTSYGVPFGMYAGDVTGDGRVTSTDTSQINTWIVGGTYDARGDLDRDGDVDSNDAATCQANEGTDLGHGKLSTTSLGNRRGYAGYEFDPVAAWRQYHVRRRVLNADYGRWLTRDPLTYGDGVSLLSYCENRVMTNVDPLGRMMTPPYIGGAVGCANKMQACENDPVYGPLLQQARDRIAQHCGGAVGQTPNCSFDAQTCGGGSCGRTQIQCNPGGGGSITPIVCGSCSGPTFCEAMIEELFHASQLCEGGFLDNCEEWTENYDLAMCLTLEIAAKRASGQCQTSPFKQCDDPEFCFCVLACGSCVELRPPGWTALNCLSYCKTLNPFDCPDLELPGFEAPPAGGNPGGQPFIGGNCADPNGGGVVCAPI